jgi:hypothetical protein
MVLDSHACRSNRLFRSGVEHVAAGVYGSGDGNYTPAKRCSCYRGQECLKDKKAHGQAFGSWLEDVPSDDVHWDAKPQVIFGGHGYRHDPPEARIGFDPKVVAEVGQDVNAGAGDGKVARKNLGWVERVDARCVEKMRRKAVSFAEIARRAVVPPKPKRVANESSVERAEASQEQGINQAAPNEAGAINAFRTLATPIIIHAVVVMQTGNISTAE